MKKAFSTVACRGLPWQDVLACAVRAGMDGVEIRMDDDGRVFGQPDESLEAIAHAFGKAGIAIVDLGCGIRFSDYCESNVEQAKRCVNLAEKIGARGLRLFPGNFVKRLSDPTPHDENGMARYLQQTADYAGEKHIEIWVETHNEFSTGRVMRKLLDKANRKNVKVIWDLIHPYEQGEMPEETLSFLGESIAHVHVKDGRKQCDPSLIDFEYTKLSEGELPIAGMVKMLEESGYNGYYSLEWENAWRPEIHDAYQNLDGILQAWNEFLRGL